MGQKNCKPQPGDLIEIFRPFYQHWALYVGDGYVIHLTSVDDESSSLWLSSSSRGATKGKVKKQRLKEVVGNNRWRVNNKYDRRRTPRPVKEIIHDAEQWIDRVVPYNVLTDNCEHFVTELRYGEGVSHQARKAGFGGVAAALGLAPLAVFCPPLLPVVSLLAAGPGNSAVVRTVLSGRKYKRSYTDGFVRKSSEQGRESSWPQWSAFATHSIVAVGHEIKGHVHATLQGKKEGV